MVCVPKQQEDAVRGGGVGGGCEEEEAGVWTYRSPQNLRVFLSAGSGCAGDGISV